VNESCCFCFGAVVVDLCRCLLSVPVRDDVGTGGCFEKCVIPGRVLLFAVHSDLPFQVNYAVI
jgi:hypothetical protein